MSKVDSIFNKLSSTFAGVFAVGGVVSDESGNEFKLELATQSDDPSLYVVRIGGLSGQDTEDLLDALGIFDASDTCCNACDSKEDEGLSVDDAGDRENNEEGDGEADDEDGDETTEVDDEGYEEGDDDDDDDETMEVDDEGDDDDDDDTVVIDIDDVRNAESISEIIKVICHYTSLDSSGQDEIVDHLVEAQANELNAVLRRKRRKGFVKAVSLYFENLNKPDGKPAKKRGSKSKEVSDPEVEPKKLGKSVSKEKFSFRKTKK